MTHWGTDELITQLQRAEGEKTLAALQEASGLGQDDFTDAVVSLKEDGIIRVEAGTAYLADEVQAKLDGVAPPAAEDEAATAEIPAVDDDEEPEEIDLGEDDPGRLIASEAAVALMEQLEAGEDAVVNAEVELRTNGDGSLELNRVVRILGVRIER